MELIIKVPEYSESTGMIIEWDYGFEVETSIENGMINIKANKQGLISLARHLLTLSQQDVPSGYHLHFDEYNSLEDGSCELVIQKG